MDAIAPQLYEFGDFRLDAASRRLFRRDGTPVPLTPRVFNTLAYLVEHHGTVLDKEMIMEAVWPDTIVEENNLTQNISTLRRVFGETPSAHRYIATVPGRGYRFVAGVNTESERAAEAPQPNGSDGHELPAAQHIAVAIPLEHDTAPQTRRFAAPRLVVLATVSVALVTVTAVWLGRSRPRDLRGSADLPEKSIAVLAFQNLSDEAVNGYFAAAVQDEILTNLAQSPELKVISRTSANAFAPGQQHNARDIAQQLHVRYLLEGSVQRIGERLRVNAQLIDARTDSHVWARIYDRPAADLVALEEEIATAIATQLGARLIASPANTATARPTENAEAYLLYLQARHFEFTSSRDEEVRNLYRKAIAADPAFALARARYAMFLVADLDSADPTLPAEARTNADEAVRLQPNLGDAHLALTCCYLNLDRDADRASAELVRAAQLLPNSVEVPLITAFICKRQNRFRDRLRALRQAEALDPLNSRVRSFLVLTLRWLREWQQAVDAVDQRAVFADNSVQFVSAWARRNDEFRLTGNLEALKQAVNDDARPNSGMPAALVNFEQYEIAMFERDYDRASQFLDAIPPAAFREQLNAMAGHLKETHQAFIAAARNADAATKAAVFARAATLPAEVGHIQGATDSALVHAVAGHKEQAIAELQSFIAQWKSADTVIERNDKLSALAAVYAQAGEPDKALDLIEHLLTVPVELQRGAVYNMTLTDLKWCWIWDPLRGNPRFQKLLASPEPKTVY